mmetsp:Transcript_31105/g.75866  ORF Transcript_31105/g.75866 Transcript_31105/m.75866 type:complete len:516 (-) Transcript_31105:407-1954(-)
MQEDAKRSKHGEDSKIDGEIPPMSARLLAGKRELASWDFVRGIGVGQFGSVVVVQPKGESSRGKKSYAMKCIGKHEVIIHKAVHRTMQELIILMKIDHPFIIRIYSAFQDENNLFLITELCEGGTLEAVLIKHNKFEIDAVQVIMGQLLLALEHIHEKGIVHMDIKLENCLVDAKGYLRLADFNACRIYGSKNMSTKSIGTPGYMAPEILSGKETHGASPDFWGVGVCTYRLLHGHQAWPFPYKSHEGILLSRNEMLDSIYSAGIPDMDKRVPEHARKFVGSLLEFEPKKRLGCGPKGFSDLKAHPFLKPLDWQKILSGESAPRFTPPPDALCSEAADKITMTKWAVEQFAITQDKSSSLSVEQQEMFRDWMFNRWTIQPIVETALDKFLTTKIEDVKSFLANSSTDTIRNLVQDIRALKRNWLDENCKLSLAEIANNDLRVENNRLEEQVEGLTKELHSARLTIMNLKKSLLDSSSVAKPGKTLLNPLTPILRSKNVDDGKTLSETQLEELKAR